jgi:hypothetical protein
MLVIYTIIRLIHKSICFSAETPKAATAKVTSKFIANIWLFLNIRKDLFTVIIGINLRGSVYGIH